MRPHGTVFDGSSNLFETHGVLSTSNGHAIWFGKFTPVNQEHLVFVKALLQTSRSLGICCAITEPTLLILRECLVHTILVKGFALPIYT
jgi:hypothetical protein